MYFKKSISYCLTLIVVLFLSCKGRIKVHNNDVETREVLNLALKTAFFQDNLPGLESLLRRDSIIFSAEPRYLSMLPNKYDSVNFKVVALNGVCKNLIENDSYNLSFLFLRSIRKSSDSIYYVSIQRRNCNPFGEGSSIGVYILKKGKSLEVKYSTSSSIN